jgi:hypothetical protein
MMVCRPKKLYYVSLYRARTLPKGGWCNYITTPYLGRAKYYAKKLKIKDRQIDVREKGKRPYVV